MKKIIIISVALLILTSCEKEEKTACFDIVKTLGGIPNEFLINKCTGETWTLQFAEYPNTKKKGQTVGSRSYQWTKINKTEQENVFNGL